LTEPGYFEQGKMANVSFSGVTLFMVLAKVTDPVAVFERMLIGARRLAASLNGVLYHERVALTAKDIAAYRHLVRTYQPK